MKQRSSPDKGDEFQPLTFERPETTPANGVSEVLRPRFSVFEIAPQSLEGIFSDPGVRREFEARVEAEVEKRIVERNVGYRVQVEKEAWRAGIEKAEAEARTLAREATEKLERICDEVAREREGILHDHEKRWCEALSHLLKRFLVPQADRIGAAVEAWLQESLASFSDKHPVLLKVAPRDFAHLQKSLGSTSGKHWQIVADAGVPNGEIHAEGDAGGFFFSPAPEAERLDTWLKEFFPSETSDPSRGGTDAA